MAETKTITQGAERLVGSLTNIFNDISGSVLGFKQRVNALEQIEKETVADNPSVTDQRLAEFLEAQKATKFSKLDDKKFLFLGGAVLLVTGIIVAKALK